MQRFESLTPQDIANIINPRTNTTLLISKEIAQTDDYAVGYVPMGMPYLPDEAVKHIITISNKWQ